MKNWKLLYSFITKNANQKKNFTETMNLLKAFPIGKNKGVLFVVSSDLSEQNIANIKKCFGDNIEIIFKPLEYVHLLIKTSKGKLSSELYSMNFDYQFYAFKEIKKLNYMVFAILVIFLLVLPYFILTSLKSASIFTIISISFLPTVLSLYKLIFITIAIFTPRNTEDLPCIENLPIYSILVPLYDENEITITNLIYSLKNFNYDPQKLDIQLLIEENDKNTLAVFQNIQLPQYIKISVIPNGAPMTKPRACNYGLSNAQGKYLTIYDAEDCPEPDQLLKVIREFDRNDKKLVCVQAALGFYNTYENWITKLFALEYISWFKYMLPGLTRFNLPIPLGGTSNHFKTDFLKSIGGWDAYNVTEDAAIGIMVYLLGYKVKVITSTTLEEATCTFTSWIKQRGRWIKGHLLTYLIYMRNPRYLYQKLGFWKFFHFNLFFGGGSIANHLYIVCTLITIIMLVFENFFVHGLMYNKLYYYIFIITISTYLLNIIAFLGIIIKERLYKLTLCIPLVPFYYLMMSISGYRALFHMIIKPSHWDKTKHGTSTVLKNLLFKINK